MKNSILKAYQWIHLSLKLFGLSIGPSLFIAMTYLLVYLLIPMAPSMQFLSPITILLWPFITVVILYYYFCINSHKKFEFSNAFKLMSKNYKGLLLLAIVSSIYAMLLGHLISSDIESISSALQKSQVNEFNFQHIIILLFKLALMGTPFYMATWFSPLLIATHNYSFFKSLKSSFAGSLMFTIPLFLASFGIIFLLLGLLFVTTYLFSMLTFISPTLTSFLSSLLVLFLIAAFVAIMFCFQLITFLSIFKKFTN